MALALGLLAALAAAAGPAFGAEEGWAYELANELMSPYCPGRALSECPSPQAEELRAWIVHQEKTGATRAEVEAQLFERFGDQLRQAPRAEGLGLLAYVIPVVLTLAGLGVVLVFFRRVQARRAESPPERAPPEIDPELARQVDEELAAAEREDGAEPSSDREADRQHPPDRAA
jgi:cytochrome c-type biogenesis protein CcmH/NrfF